VRLLRPQSGVIKPVVAVLVAKGEISGAQEIMHQRKQSIGSAKFIFKQCEKIS
jgi:hypothetical protein